MSHFGLHFAVEKRNNIWIPPPTPASGGQLTTRVDFQSKRFSRPKGKWVVTPYILPQSCRVLSPDWRGIRGWTNLIYLHLFPNYLHLKIVDGIINKRPARWSVIHTILMTCSDYRLSAIGYRLYLPPPQNAAPSSPPTSSHPPHQKYPHIAAIS